MKDRGFSLIELLIIVAIVSILAVALGFQFSGWIGSYNVESQTKNMYIDLMNARARAMGRNRMHCVTFATMQYTVTEDRLPEPDGNVSCTDDTPILQKNTSNTITPTLFLIDSTKGFYFDKNGVASNIDISDPTKISNARLVSTATPDYDCIVLEPTRINMGKWNGTSCDAR